MSLHDLPVFGTTREVDRCTKFLISRVHKNTLWLDQAYPIHVEDIHKLIGFPWKVRMSQTTSKALGSMVEKRVKLAYMTNIELGEEVTEHTLHRSMMNRSAHGLLFDCWESNEELHERRVHP
jgi:hypothetical protein